MAYTALVSGANSWYRLEEVSQVSALPISLDAINSEVGFLKEIIFDLEHRSRSQRVKIIDGLIRDALYGLEDVIDSLLSDLMLNVEIDHSIYEQGINSFVENRTKISEEYSTLEFEEEEDKEEESPTSSSDDFGGKFVGLSKVLNEVRHDLVTSYRKYELQVVSLVGVSGTGRSYVARKIFRQAGRRAGVKLRAWVRVGPKYQLKEILARILYQICEDDVKLVATEAEIFECLHTRLKGGRFLIVLEDVRETGVWEHLKRLFPDENNGSRVVLTTHLQVVARFANSSTIYPTRVLTKQDTWNLLSRILFGNRFYRPLELEEAAKKIAENCKGLVVEIAKIASILYEVDRTPEDWSMAAADHQMKKSDAMDAYDELAEIDNIRTNFSDGRPPEIRYIIKRNMFASDGATIDDVIRDVLLIEVDSSRHVVSVVGMVGIGKTALARQIFDDPWTLRSYDHRVWLTLGPKYQVEGLFADITAQLDPSSMRLKHDDDTSAEQIIRSMLCNKKCFFVLDDLCSLYPLVNLEKLLKDFKCEVLLTTRLLEIPLQYTRPYGAERIHEMPLLNIEESQNLLRERVFGEELCPRELEKPGKLIAENDGLPLMIVTVASLLSEAGDKTPEYWNEVAKIRSSVFEDAYQKISKVLYPIYKDLNRKSRPCYLYMAVFPLRFDIPISKLIMLSGVEGIPLDTSYDLVQFIKSSLILAHLYKGSFKTCRLHSVYWHFCVREARNDRFFHVMSCYADGSAQVLQPQRRLCIHNNVLFAIKDVYSSMASASAVRSILCLGPLHQYQIPICFGQKLLKVLDALTIRFYELPIGILNLVLLTFLALTYDGQLPASISQLWNLEFLILHRYRMIKSPGDLSCLPVEIWDMKRLRYLQIKGRNLPEVGPDSDAALEKLLALKDVRPESCTHSILERLPNVQRLGVRIELAPDASEPSFSFEAISRLQKLETLKCVVVNPVLKYEIVPPPVSFSMLPSGLEKLSLSGFGYPWECIRPIALLPNLEELKLKCYAFRGSEWVLHEGDFRCLKYLLIEDTDLAHWTTHDYCYLQSLEFLTIRHLYRLKDMPWDSISTSCETEIVDCNSSALRRMPENYTARVYSSSQGGKSGAHDQTPPTGSYKVLAAQWRKGGMISA